MPHPRHTQRGRHNSQVNCCLRLYQPAAFLLVWALLTELAGFSAEGTLSIQEIRCFVQWGRGSGLLRTLLRRTTSRQGLIRIWSHTSLLIEGKPLNVMTLMVGIYPNQSQMPSGAAGASRSCYSGDPHCVYCDCKHQKGHGQVCWTGPCSGQLAPCRGYMEYIGGCAAKGRSFVQ